MYRLVYDDDCEFCTEFAEWASDRGPYRLRAFSNLTEGEKEKLPPNYEDCAHVITADGVLSCDETAWHVLDTIHPHASKLVRAPGVWEAWNFGYKVIADNRSKVSPAATPIVRIVRKLQEKYGDLTQYKSKATGENILDDWD